MIWNNGAEFLQDLYCSPNIVRVVKSRGIKWARHGAPVGENNNTFRVLVGNPEDGRSRWRPGRIVEDNIKVGLEGGGWESVHWLIRIRTGTSGGLLWIRWRNCEFYKLLEVCWLAEELLAFQERVFSVQLVRCWIYGWLVCLCAADTYSTQCMCHRGRLYSVVGLDTCTSQIHTCTKNSWPATAHTIQLPKTKNRQLLSISNQGQFIRVTNPNEREWTTSQTRTQRNHHPTGHAILHHWITCHWPPLGLQSDTATSTVHSTTPMPHTPQHQPTARDYHTSRNHRYNQHTLLWPPTARQHVSPIPLPQPTGTLYNFNLDLTLI
jgi:hypothetical protein